MQTQPPSANTLAPTSTTRWLRKTFLKLVWHLWGGESGSWKPANHCNQSDSRPSTILPHTQHVPCHKYSLSAIFCFSRTRNGNWPEGRTQTPLVASKPKEELWNPLLLHLNWKLGPAIYAIKIKNCSITKPHTDALQASLSPHTLSLPAQLVFFFRKMTIILKSMSLFGVAEQFIF